ncbi:MAG: bifunctional [glutamine synthetase] adenylyltransferase/[glutamine synthetase]-adenylyl-L-tyrosine phosphorylase [Propionicimonas sp.]|uniref:bifunctional [glutamine synthetase] adenylyltransferase/[glutamine synthetase]-adenylyl-L-tyrosine phosphorylase n=1 Tax=Propionicimonas sp. TaxID=1955623 RepID=UPI003D0C4793
MSRIESPSARLARLGFADAVAAAAMVEAWEQHGTQDQIDLALAELPGTADPDLALAGFNRLLAARPTLFAELGEDAAFARRLIAVLGASSALNQHLGTHPDDVAAVMGSVERRTPTELRAELLLAVGADPDSPVPVAEKVRSDDLRRAYRRALLRIAARDLTAPDPLLALQDIAGELADLADGTVETALALARGEVPGWEKCRIGIVALGKTGAGELNYVSDVDVLYLAEPALDDDGEPVCDPGTAVAVATRLASALTRVCSAHTGAGTIWQIDAALRPEGKAGPLVRTLASHRAYYEKWAKNWEFQAMLKARPMAGDLALAESFVDMVWPMVWRVADNDQFVGEVQAMRRRVISLLPAREANTEIKLGAGGLRDVEFSVQLLQLVHGRSDERLRLRGTFDALSALVDHGYVGRADGYDLATAYQLQRLLEHRIQLYRLRRTHLMPDDETNQRWLARAIGLPEPKELMHLWRSTARRVLTLHQRLFYSPLLETVARIPSSQVGLTPEAAEVRLRALGYGDAKAALRHIEALSHGMTRQAEIQRQLLPAMLTWFAAGPNPDHGLLAFRQVSEELGSTPWYLRTLRDGDVMAEHLAKILASSRYAVDLLMRAPQNAALLGDPEGLRPRPGADILAEMLTASRRHESPDAAIAAVRATRRRELLRLAMADLLGDLDVPALGRALSDLAGATIDAALEVASRGVKVPPIAVIAMGRWGGCELSYASDADAMFVVADSDDPDATSSATTVVSRLRALLAKPGPDPALEVDIDLRPEGKGGAMVRSLASYRAYYERWSSTWEAQALLRASAGAGDRALGTTLLADIDRVRYPKGGLSHAQVHEIRKLKARMEAERLPRAADPGRHVKLGPGGLSDVEWVVQLLQLHHAGGDKRLRTTGTLEALDATVLAGLLDEADAEALRAAWLLASRIRNAITLLRGRATDSLPTDVRELSAVAQILGYAKGDSSQFTEDFRRGARLARQVMDRVFWDTTD